MTKEEEARLLAKEARRLQTSELVRRIAANHTQAALAHFAIAQAPTDEENALATIAADELDARLARRSFW